MSQIGARSPRTGLAKQRTLERTEVEQLVPQEPLAAFRGVQGSARGAPAHSAHV